MQALFSVIITLFEKECTKPLKIAHKISKKALHPTAIEKTNVQLFNGVFHESTIAGLEFYKEAIPGAEGTAKFLKLIRKAWNIVNVKTPLAGLQKRDDSRKPITSPTDSNLLFLESFVSWLEKWEGSAIPLACLTKETMMAMKHTCTTLCTLARYLLQEKNFSFVLLGQFQSDPIESSLKPLFSLSTW